MVALKTKSRQRYKGKNKMCQNGSDIKGRAGKESLSLTLCCHRNMYWMTLMIIVHFFIGVVYVPLFFLGSSAFKIYD